MNGIKPDALTADPLAELHDIHLPEAIGWWPLAPGWYLLLIIVLLFIAATYYFWRWRKMQKHQPIVFSNQDVIQAAMLELDSIEQSDADNRQRLADISQLLRRCALQLTRLNHVASTADYDVAGLTGKAWFSWLDSRWQRDDFRQGAGRLLIDAPYRNAGIEDADVFELCCISRAWLKSQGQTRS